MSGPSSVARFIGRIYIQLILLDQEFFILRAERLWWVKPFLSG